MLLSGRNRVVLLTSLLLIMARGVVACGPPPPPIVEVGPVNSTGQFSITVTHAATTILYAWRGYSGGIQFPPSNPYTFNGLDATCMTGPENLTVTACGGYVPGCNPGIECINVTIPISPPSVGRPSVSVQVVETGSTHRADVQYAFPSPPNDAGVDRRVRLRAWDADGALRTDQTTSPTVQSGTWPVALDTSCWPDGSARVEVQASWCLSTEPVIQEQAFVVRNQPDVTVSVRDDPAAGPKARVTWEFPRAPGNVRLVMIVPPSAAEIELANFTPETLSGSLEYSFTPPVEARTVTIQGRASGAQACHYDVDAVSYACTCRSVGDPVDIADGNMRYSDADPLPAGGAFGFSRVYDSRQRIVGRFGDGWTSALDARITLNRPYSIIVVTENNEPYVFVEKGAVGTTFEQRWPRDAARGRLVHDAGSGTYAFTPAGGGRTWVYTATTGRLAEIRDLGSDRAVRFAYDAAGLPTSVSDSWGTWSWTIGTNAATGLIGTITVDGRPDLAWSYEYDTDKRLLRAVAPGALTWRAYVYVAGRMTEARDAAGKLIESHTYDARGWATSSRGPSGEISAIAYAIASAAPDETITRVTSASGAITEYRMRLAGGTPLPVGVDGGCASCGVAGEGTSIYDPFGLLERQQDARGYISNATYDQRTHRLLSRTTHLQPFGCDPETDPTRCRQTPESLREVGLQATSASITNRYTYDDPNWPDRPTAIAAESILSTLGGRPRRIASQAEGDLQTKRETMTYDAASGALLSRSVSGWTGDPQRFETRLLESTALYNGTESAEFNPGGTFEAAWLSLPQAPRQRKSIDGARADVDDRTLFFYYPVHASVPATSRGRLAAIRNAVGHITRFERYDVFGNAERVVDPNGVATESTFDALGRIRTTTIKGISGCDTGVDALCATDLTTTRTYSGVGPLETEVRPGGGVTAWTYDARGRIATISRGLSATDLRERVEYDYDAAHGKKNLERSLALEATIWVEKKKESFAYNIKGQLQTVTHEDGTAVHYAYDVAHQVGSVRDENHAEPNTRYTYDPAGRLLRVTQTLSTTPDGQIVTTYGYDAHGNLSGVSDPNGNVTSYLYDDFGQMNQQISPVTGATTYTYNIAGQVVSTTDANGATAARTYDAMGRILTTIATRPGVSAETVTWAYDDATAGRFAIGRLASMTDPAGTTAYSYERRGLLRFETRTFTNGVHTYSTTYGFDRDGNRNSIGYPSALHTVSYTHDYAGRPLTASGAITDAAYMPFGPLKTLKFANGLTQSLEYDTRYRIKENQLAPEGGPTSSAIARYSYVYDAVGNIKQINDHVDSTYDRRFTYDDLDRILTADTGLSLWDTGVFSWDAMGNILTMNLNETQTPPGPGGGGERRPSKPKKNKPPDNNRTPPLGRTSSFQYVETTSRLAAVTLNDVPVSVAHDAAGNQTFYAVTRTYSPRNLLQTVIDPGEPGETLLHTVAYGYDGRGVRVVRAESPNGAGGTARRFYIYTPELQLLAETRDDTTNIWEPAPPPSGLADKNVKHEIVWFGDRPVAQIAPGAAPLFTFADHLGTPLLQTNVQQSIVWRVEHEPFGNIYVVRDGERGDQPLRFPGQEAASTWEGAEENYNIFRWYRSGWGRYTQADPIGLGGGINVFSYVGGNPLRRVDPDGLRARCPCGEWATMLIAVGPVNAIAGRSLANEARSRSGNLNPSLPGPWNGPQDAFRHCFWSCRMAQDLGREIAEKIGNIHEDCSSNPPAEHAMDLHNNAIGRSLGYPGINCEKACLGALRRRELQSNPAGTPPQDIYNETAY